MFLEVEEQLRQDIVEGAKSIFQKSLVSMNEGNISARIPNRDEILITPASNNYRNMQKEDVVQIRFDGSLIDKGKQASREYRLHLAVYRARKEVRYIIHSHSPYATMFSVVGRDIPIILEEMTLFLGGKIKVASFTHAHSDEIGRIAVETIGKANCVLLGNHGVLVCGRTIEYTVNAAELVEKMAFIYWGASKIGEPKTIPIEKQLNLMKDFKRKFATY
jgi:L-fuculose-phosphate aldolase